MEKNIVGVTFDSLSEEEMRFIVGGDGEPATMSTPTTTYPASYIVSAAVSSAASSAVVSWIASAWANCA